MARFDPVGTFWNATTERTIAADVADDGFWRLWSSSGTVLETGTGTHDDAVRAAARALDAEHERMRSVGQTVDPITWVIDTPGEGSGEGV